MKGTSGKGKSPNITLHKEVQMSDKKEVIGVDVSCDEQKLVRIIAQDGQQVVTECLSFPIETKLAMSSNRVWLAARDKLFFQRTFSLPPVAERNIAPLVEYEAKQLIPFPIDDVAYDWYPSEGENEYEIQMCAIQQKKLDKIKKIGSLSGVVPAYVPMYVYLKTIAPSSFLLYKSEGCLMFLISDGEKVWTRPINEEEDEEVIKKDIKRSLSYYNSLSLERKNDDPEVQYSYGVEMEGFDPLPIPEAITNYPDHLIAYLLASQVLNSSPAINLLNPKSQREEQEESIEKLKIAGSISESLSNWLV